MSILILAILTLILPMFAEIPPTWNLLQPHENRTATFNLTALSKERFAVTWDPGQTPTLQLMPARQNWSPYNTLTLWFFTDTPVTINVSLLGQQTQGTHRNDSDHHLRLPYPGWHLFNLRLNDVKKDGGKTADRNVTAITFTCDPTAQPLPENHRIRFLAPTLFALPSTHPLKTLPPPTTETCWPMPEKAAEINSLKPLAENPLKLAAIETMRQKRKPTAYAWKEPLTRKAKHLEYLSLIDDTGAFRDCPPQLLLEQAIRRKSPDADPERIGEIICNHIVHRLLDLLISWNNGTIPQTKENERKLKRTLIHYLTFEFNRPGYRWVAASFKMPKCAAETYFTFFSSMQKVERQLEKDPDMVLLNQLCKAVAMQAFYQPLRIADQKTIPYPICTRQFQGHGAWVGGNFGYRPLLDCALLCRNPVMIDVIAEVGQKALGLVSWNTRKQAFWQEGITADRAGWGHGKQNYLFGYPLHGLMTIVKTARQLQDTPWNVISNQEQADLLLDYAETTLWFSFNPMKYGPTLMTPGRIAMRYNHNTGFLRYPYQFLHSLEKLPHMNLTKWTILRDIAHGKRSEMTGIRYFWNNDDMIARGDGFFIGINMTSMRTASNEVIAGDSSHTECLGDGATFIMSAPDTYTLAKGFWNPTAIPGTTLRQGQYEHPLDTWSGFSGMHNFAGGVTHQHYGLCAFIYEKAPAYKYDVPILYKLKAQKSYFLVGDSMLCIGSGIDNLNTQLPGNIQTTIDQTEWKQPVQFSSDKGENIREARPGQHVTCQLTLRGQPFLACHRNVAYAVLPFPKDASVTLEGETRQEKWLLYNRNYNTPNTDRPRNLPVLQLQINHGRQVKNGTYAYLVKMNQGNLKEFARQLENADFKIVSASPQAHAVYYPRQGLLQAVSFQPQTEISANGRSWKADAPAVFLIASLDDDTLLLKAADPQQSPERQHITLSCTPPVHGRNSFAIPLPQGDYCGKAGSLRVNLKDAVKTGK